MVEELLITIGLAIVAIAGGLARQWALSRFTPGRLSSLEGLASVAVSAAEQSGADNPSKRELASESLVNLARRLGFKLKPAEVAAFIEAAVNQMRELERLEGEAREALANNTA